MLEKLEGSGALDVKYGSILGEVLLYNEIKKSRLYTLNSKFDLSGKSIVCLNVEMYLILKKQTCYVKIQNYSKKKWEENLYFSRVLTTRLISLSENFLHLF